MTKEHLLANKIRDLANKMKLYYFPDMESRCSKMRENIDTANSVVNSRMSSLIQSYDYRHNDYYQSMIALEEALQRDYDEEEIQYAEEEDDEYEARKA